MFDALVVATATAELLLGSGLLVTLASGARVWPPPGTRSWQFWFVWLLTIVTTLGVAGTGVARWGTLGFPGWIRFGLGAPAMIAGFSLAIWSVAWLGWQSLGLSGALVTSGPYRVSRNPQYVGDVVGLMGWGVLCASAWTLVLAAGAAGLLLVTPLAEEPWLEERHGDEYRRYRRLVPRYIGLP